MSRCGDKLGVGKRCDEQSDCAEGLGCLLLRNKKSCENSDALKVGEECQVPAVNMQCGVEKFVNGTVKSKCLEEGGSFACRIERGLFESCAASTDVCQSGLQCNSNFQLCVEAS